MGDKIDMTLPEIEEQFNKQSEAPIGMSVPLIVKEDETLNWQEKVEKFNNLVVDPKDSTTVKVEEPKVRLFDIQAEYLAISQAISESDGVITPEQDAALKVNAEGYKQKLQSYKYIIGLNDAENLAIDKEVERLGKIKKGNIALNTKLSSNISEAISTFGNDRKAGGKELNWTMNRMWITNPKPLVVNDPIKLLDCEKNAYVNKDIALKLPIDVWNKLDRVIKANKMDINLSNNSKLVVKRKELIADLKNKDGIFVKKMQEQGVYLDKTVTKLTMK